MPDIQIPDTPIAMTPSERINVKWRPGVSSGAKNRLRQDRGLRRVPGYELLEAEGWDVCELPRGLAKKEIEWLLNHPNVLAAESEGFGMLIQPVDISAVGLLGDLGAMLAVLDGTEWWQRFVKAPEAWAVTEGQGAIAGVCDNGLGPHWFTDPRVVETKIFDLAETDSLGGSHGNPVTGCGVGIAPHCGVTNYKIAGADVRCSWTDVSNALLHAKVMGRKIVNLSYGGGSSFTLIDALVKCKASGMAIVCAAGNSSGATQFPGNNANAYAVSALDEAGNIAGFSCRGKIDISAPGVNLLTTTSGGGWAHFSGTSGAAPIVSGILLLILARNPSWTGVQAMEHLMATATPKLPVTDYGAGLPNAAKAVGAEETAPPPEPPPPEPPLAAPVLDITSLAAVTASFPAYEAAGEGLGNLTDGTTRKCLWFTNDVTVTFKFPRKFIFSHLLLKSANDYPTRDPVVVVASGEVFAPQWTARHQDREFVFEELIPVADTLVVHLVSSTEWSPGDKGQGILQLSELRIFGWEEPLEPPPEPPPPLPEPPPPPPPTRAELLEEALDDLGANSVERELAYSIDRAIGDAIVSHNRDDLKIYWETSAGLVTLAF